VTAHRAHIHGFHSGRPDGGHTEVGVFVSAAEARLDTDAPSGFKENIRRWLLVPHHFAGDDSIEKMTDAKFLQHTQMIG
jgi:hypothetical protein